MPFPLAAVCLLLVIAGLSVAAFFGSPNLVVAHIPFPEAPEMLASRVREFVRMTGYKLPVRDEAMGWEYNEPYLKRVLHLKDAGERTEALKHLQPPPILFWYRQTAGIFYPLNGPEVTRTDPPFANWMIEAAVDPRGRLVELYAYPSLIGPEKPPLAMDWTKLLTAAGFDPAKLEPVDSPVFLAKTDSDAKAAWKGVYPDSPRESFRIEGASFRGLPVMFRVLAETDSPYGAAATGAAGPSDAARGQLRWVLFFIVILPVLAAAIAWRNVSRGRGDIRGAARLAMFTFLLDLACYLLLANHVPSLVEAAVLWKVLLRSVFGPVLMFVLYLAIEPYIRRRLPDSLVSWSRLLMGKWRDPRVAADVLVGLASAFAVMLITMLGPAGQAPRLVPLPASGAEFAAARFRDISWCIGGGLNFVFLFSLARFLLRRRWLAAGVTVLLVCMIQLGIPSLPSLPFALAVISVITLVLGGRGLLAITAFVFANVILTAVPFTLDFSLWYAGQSLLVMLMMTGIAAYGFWANLGGRTLWKEEGDAPEAIR